MLIAASELAALCRGAGVDVTGCLRYLYANHRAMPDGVFVQKPESAADDSNATTVMQSAPLRFCEDVVTHVMPLGSPGELRQKTAGMVWTNSG